MNRRSWVVVWPVAVAGLLAGGAVAFWATDASPFYLRVSADRTQPAVVDIAPSAQIERSTGTASVAGADLKVDTSAPLNLHKDDGQDTARKNQADTKDESESLRSFMAREKKASKSTSEPELDIAQPSSAPLNLEMPEIEQGLVAQGTQGIEPEPKLDEEAAGDASERAALDVAAPTAPGPPKVTTYSLFNPEYGLRGFMKQQWLNNTFGFQGGLGFNDGRRIPSRSSDIRDDIAVGMGVILAF